MSLIERAIDKLGPATAPTSPQIVRSAPPDPDAMRGGTVERAMSRIADGPVCLPEQVAAPVEPLRLPTRAKEERAATGMPPAPIRIDVASLRARGFVTADTVQGAIGNEFRVIKRPLLSKAFGRGTDVVENGRRVMVTSALPGEGKSFCAINLALSIASERDHQVLLVDADVARPSIPRQLGIEAGPGLMDWLVDGTPALEDLVRPTSVDKLSLLTAGRRHDHATELLASDAMSRLLEQLSTRYPDSLIIFDSPPLLVTTESRVLASYMGQVVMVVEAGRTPRDAVRDALSTIGRPEIVGLLLNKSAHGNDGSPYGYQGYGYGDH